MSKFCVNSKKKIFKQKNISCPVHLGRKLGFRDTLETECSSCSFKKDVESSDSVDDNLSDSQCKK